MSTGVFKQFYNSAAWKLFREQIITARTREHGALVCEICGKPIIHNDIEIHHTPIELSAANIDDVNVTLNPDNVKIVHSACHNAAHGRFCGGRPKRRERAIYIVYGAPMSGKSSYVRENMERGDMVIDMDALFSAMSFQPQYDKPDNLARNVFAVRNLMIDNIKTRYGGFRTAWIIGGYPEKYQREKLAADLGAELVYIAADKSDCMYRLKYCNDYRQRHAEEWAQYIADWFDKYVP